MKQRILKILALTLVAATAFASFTGCSFMSAEEEGYLTPDDYEPVYYTSEAEIPEDAYYIVRKDVDEDGNAITKYYPLLAAETTFTDVREKYAGYDASRVTWVNYNLDEGLIPTMYAGDKLIYKSSTYIPTTYALEKFFDNGYTFGVAGLEQDLSGNYKYVSNGNSGKGYVMTTSDATGFDAIDADSIYFVAVGDTRVSPTNMSSSGTITGLNLMETYSCDIRTGTEKLAADLLCNIHYFSSAETYMFGSFTFITDIIAELNVPEYVTTGYYRIGEGGFFRYIADEAITDYRTLSDDDYNATIYTYDETDGTVNGTTVGLVFDPETYFLVAGDSTTDTTNTAASALTYEDMANSTEKEITNKTSLEASDSGIYTGNFVIDTISDPIIENGSYVFELACTTEDNGETLNLRYILTTKNNLLEEGMSVLLTFKETTDDFDGYEIITVSDLNKANDDGSEEEVDEAEADAETEVDTETEMEEE